MDRPLTLCSYGRCSSEAEWSLPDVGLCQDHWEAWCNTVFWASMLGGQPPLLVDWAAAGTAV